MLSTAFEVLIDDLQEEANEANLSKHYEALLGEDRIVCYTDGSKLESGSVGAAVFIPFHALATESRCFSLEKYATVFQAEVYAIYKMATLLYDCRDYYAPSTVVICSDSRSVLMAFKSQYMRSIASWIE